DAPMCFRAMILMPVSQIAGEDNIGTCRGGILFSSILLHHYATWSIVWHLPIKNLKHIMLHALMIVAWRGHVVNHAIDQLQVHVLRAILNQEVKQLRLHVDEARVFIRRTYIMENSIDQLQV